jgi:outer membrane protein assembly factor BamB
VALTAFASLAAVSKFAAGVQGDTAVRKPGPPPSMLWHVQGEGRGRPVADDWTAYFLSKRHEVVAVAAQNGARRWSQGTGGTAEATEGSAVVLAGSVVVAGDYNLIAFDRATGAVRWRFIPVVGYAPGIYLGESNGRTVFAGSPAGRVYALDAETGDPLWTTTVIDDGRTTIFQPATDGGILVAGFTTFAVPHAGGVVALDPATGSLLWISRFPPSAYDPTFGTGSTGNPIFADSVVVASAGNGFVYGLSRVTGRILWSLPPIPDVPPVIQGPFPIPPSPEGADYRPLTYSARTLFVGSLKGHVIAYDMDTRRERWRYRDDHSGSVSLGIASDARSVYVPYASGRHVALNAANGGERWRTVNGGDGFNWPVYSTADRIYLSGAGGGFNAIAP